jgi:AcrR family transcriptional regulator
VSSQVSSQVSSTPRRELRPRQAETVDRLLAAGAEELRAVGVDDLTIRTVALRAGVSSATAYTYFASKNHLFAELFWRRLTADAFEPKGRTVVQRVQSVGHAMSDLLEDAPEVAAGARSALLGTDPDVVRLRLRIGTEFVQRFERALGPDLADPALADALTLTFTGALLQAGMGLTTYPEMRDRLDAAVAAIMKGHPQ